MARKISPRIFQSEKDSLWYWSLPAGNGEVTCRAEGYSSKSNAKRGFLTAQRVMARAEVS